MIVIPFALLAVWDVLRLIKRRVAGHMAVVEINKPFTARQLTLFCAVSLISPATQILPHWASMIGKSGWLLLLPALPFNLLLALMLGNMIKKQPTMGLAEIYVHSLGKFFGKTFLLISGVIVPLTMVSFSNRLFASRFTSTIFPYSPDFLFLIPTMALTLFITRNSLDRAVRMGSVCFPVALTALLVIFAGSLGSIKSENLLPLSPGDYPSLLVCSSVGLSVFGIFALGGLLTGNVSNRQSIFTETRRSMLIMTAMLTLLLIICIGVLGAGLTRRVGFPVFSAIKSLSIPGVLERVDAFAITLWMLSDIALMLLYFMTASHTLGYILGIKDCRRLVAPLHVVALAACIFIGDGLLSVQKAARYVVEPTGFAVIILSAVTVFAVGKLRGRL